MKTRSLKPQLELERGYSEKQGLGIPDPSSPGCVLLLPSEPTNRDNRRLPAGGRNLGVWEK